MYYVRSLNVRSCKTSIETTQATRNPWPHKHNALKNTKTFGIIRAAKTEPRTN